MTTDDKNQIFEEPTENADPAQTAIPTPLKKKPYVKPAFRYEKVFVTTALSCGKISATSSQCQFTTKAS